jgi:pyridoxine 5-phosphate synthase
MAKKNIRLGVNIDHAATLRQARGNTTAYPDLLNLAVLAVRGGAEQITIHLREDRRHIQESDLALLSEQCPVPLNLEMAATPAMLRLAKKYKPSWACFVPESREELTTEGGLNVKKKQKKIAPIVEKLQSIGVEISMFIEPSLEQVKASLAVGAEAVEFHTGKWVRLKGRAKDKEWKRLCEAAEVAHDLGLGVHAGHGLDFETTMRITKLPHLEEVNIGHSVICYSMEYGIEKTTEIFRKILQGKKL